MSSTFLPKLRLSDFIFTPFEMRLVFFEEFCCAKNVVKEEFRCLFKYTFGHEKNLLEIAKYVASISVTFGDFR